RLLAVLHFFTTLPFPVFIARRADHKSGLARAAHWFPVAGLVIGTAIASVWLAAASALPAWVAAGVAIGAGMALTGALHEDGLADCADGLGGGERERALEIMRDSRIGTYGVVAILLSVGLRWSVLATLPVSAGVVALIAAHAVSRAAIVIALRFSSYARTEGTGSLVAAGVTTGKGIVTLAIALAIAVSLAGLPGIAAFLAGLAASALVLLRMERRINGYTGDVLGAMQQAAEIAVLLALTALWAYPAGAPS
ncbi:MAG: adenosylcobinamide-GDP ribazoletransferase, partial [Pseudomonadota bacterium]|nr:adenosylcobinamide-GDP ribazoletransferase [Pseudomonadota bacterium]